MNRDERNKLVLDNMALVTHIIKKEIYMGLDEFDDLFQEGCLALTLAAERFNPSLGFKFTTYAYSYIHNHLRTYKSKKTIDRHGLVLSRKFQEEYIELNRAIHDKCVDESDYMEVSKLISELGLNNVTCLSFKSINSYIDSDSDSKLTFEDVLKDEMDCYEDSNLGFFIDDILACLKGKISTKGYAILVDILYEYYVSGISYSYSYYAEKYEVSRNSIFRYLSKAKEILRNNGLIKK